MEIEGSLEIKSINKCSPMHIRIRELLEEEENENLVNNFKKIKLTKFSLPSGYKSRQIYCKDSEITQEKIENSFIISSGEDDYIEMLKSYDDPDIHEEFENEEHRKQVSYLIDDILENYDDIGDIIFWKDNKIYFDIEY